MSICCSNCVNVKASWYSRKVFFFIHFEWSQRRNGSLFVEMSYDQCAAISAFDKPDNLINYKRFE